MPTFSSVAAGDGGDMQGGFSSRSAGAEASTDQMSPIKEEEEELAAVVAQVAGAATAVVDGGNRTIRRLRRKLRRAAPDWSSLPEPAIHLILMGMRPSLGDVFSFAGVCKAWRSVFADLKGELFSSLPPLLLDCGSSPDALGRFYSLVKQRFFRRKHPIPRRLVRPGGPLDLSDWSVSAVSHGYWIITPVKKNSQGRSVFLLDPLFPESSRIELPPSPLSFSKPGSIGAGVFCWALMTAPPTSPDCVVVVAERRCIWYCRRGDAEWVRHDFSDDGLDGWMVTGLYQVAVLGGRLYGLVSFKKLVVVELLFPRPKVAVMDVEGLPALRGQLLESDGEILYIADKIYRRCEIFDRRHLLDVLYRYKREHKYVVQQLNLPARRWVVLDTLGNRSIFLPRHFQLEGGRGTPITSVGAAEWGRREDCIYFICVSTGKLAVWSMKDRSVEHHSLPRERCSCEWLVPSFSYRW